MDGLSIVLDILSYVAQGLVGLGISVLIFFIALVGYFMWTGDFHE